MTGKCQSFVRDLSFWPALRTPRQFSQKVQGTDHLLCAFWTAGLTTRPPDIGPVWCTPIFQISHRTIVCILKRSDRLYGDSIYRSIQAYGPLSEKFHVLRVFQSETYIRKMPYKSVPRYPSFSNSVLFLDKYSCIHNVKLKELDCYDLILPFATSAFFMLIKIASLYTELYA